MEPEEYKGYTIEYLIYQASASKVYYQYIVLHKSGYEICNGVTEIDFNQAKIEAKREIDYLSKLLGN